MLIRVEIYHGVWRTANPPDPDAPLAPFALLDPRIFHHRDAEGTEKKARRGSESDIYGRDYGRDKLREPPT